MRFNRFASVRTSRLLKFQKDVRFEIEVQAIYKMV